MKNSSHPFHKVPLLRLLAAAALLLSVTSIVAGGKPSRWDTESAARKADYIFLEAERRKAIEQVDAYFDLLSEARRLNPSDKIINSDFGFYQIVISEKDSALIAEGYGRMRDYFLANPGDIYNGLTFARMSSMLGMPDNERDAWRRLHSVYPERTEISLRLAQTLLESPDSIDRRRAIVLFDSIETTDGKDMQLSNMKIHYFLGRKDTTAVYGELQSLLEAFPRSAQAAAYVGDVHAALGDREGALRYYRQACATDSTDGYAFYSLANFYNSIGDTRAYNDAIVHALSRKSLDLETKLKIFGSFIESHGGMAVQDTVADAIDSVYVEEILQANPGGTPPAQDSATENFEERVDALFKVLLDEYPHEAELYNFYTSYLLSVPDFEGAAEQLSHSLDIDPSDEQRWMVLISLDLQTNEEQNAEQDALRAMRYFPENARIPLLLASVYQVQKRYSEAREYLKKAEELTDSADVASRSAILTTMGDIEYAEGNKDKAFPLYSQALEIDPENYTALNNAAYYMACENRDLDKALTMIERVVAKRPDEPTSLDTYAWVLFKLKRYPEALEAIEKAIKAIPEENLNGEELEHAGDINFMNGHRDKALEYWKKALELDKENDLLRRKVKMKTIFFE